MIWRLLERFGWGWRVKLWCVTNGGSEYNTFLWAKNNNPPDNRCVYVFPVTKVHRIFLREDNEVYDPEMPQGGYVGAWWFHDKPAPERWAYGQFPGVIDKIEADRDEAEI